MIRILEDRVVNQIAAGEVVARPASVVKELVENAIDAGADQIRIDLVRGGCTSIRVRDNGRGMSKTDATMCLERHATSKIRLAEDLVGVRTLGFRGEAIPSIAAVSQFEITTRPAGEEVATRVQVEGGKLTRVSEAGGPPGTRVTVKDLFFNLPARKKFLRKPQTELGHCTETVIRQLLNHPEVDVEVTHEGKRLIRAAVHPSLNDRAAALLGATGRQLIAISSDSGGIGIEGLVSPIGVHKGSGRGSSYHYVNGRHVQDPVLRRAVAEAYRGLVPRGRYPVVVLRLEVPGSDVDVNVHPAKTEVRFQDALAISRAITQSLRSALGHVEPVPTLPTPGILQGSQQTQLGILPPKVSTVPRNTHLKKEERPIVRPSVRALASSTPAPPRAPVPKRPSNRAPMVERQADREPIAYLGNLNNQLLVFRVEQDLWLVDQARLEIEWTAWMLIHVAAGESRPLLAPCIIDLESQEYSRLIGHLEVFAELGMLIEDFGSQSLIVKAVPSVLASKELARLLINVANSASLRRGACGMETLAKLLASEAGAGPNDALSPYELCQKMKDVRDVRNQIGFALTQDELEDRLARKGIRRE